MKRLLYVIYDKDSETYLGTGVEKEPTTEFDEAHLYSPKSFLSGAFAGIRLDLQMAKSCFGELEKAEVISVWATQEGN